MRSASDMSSNLQTLLAFAVVLIAALWLARRALAKKKSGGCGGDCCAVSPEVKKLQARLKQSR